MLLQQGEARLLGSYFFLQRGRVLTNPWLNKFYLMVDALTRRRTDGALVRAEMLLAPQQSEAEGMAVLDGFLAEVWGVLGAYVPN